MWLVFLCHVHLIRLKSSALQSGAVFFFNEPIRAVGTFQEGGGRLKRQALKRKRASPDRKNDVFLKSEAFKHVFEQKIYKIQG